MCKVDFHVWPFLFNIELIKQAWSPLLFNFQLVIFGIETKSYPRLDSCVLARDVNLVQDWIQLQWCYEL